MKNLFKYVLLTIFIVSTVGCASNKRPVNNITQKIRPATNADFSGYWRIVLIPNHLHKNVKNESMGFSDPCQFLVHKPDGIWDNITITNGAGVDETVRQCTTTTKSLIDIARLSKPASPFRWNKNQFQDGFFYIKNSSITDPKAIAGNLWKVDYVTEDFPAAGLFGFDLKKGEMIMQLTQVLEGNRVLPVWSMVLRPVLE